MSTTERIGLIFRDALAIEVPAPSSDLFDSGLLDSLALVTLLFEVEQQFAIALPLDDIDSLRSIERIAALVDAAAVQQPAPPAGTARIGSGLR